MLARARHYVCKWGDANVDAAEPTPILTRFDAIAETSGGFGRYAGMYENLKANVQLRMSLTWLVTEVIEVKWK